MSSQRNLRVLHDKVDLFFGEVYERHAEHMECRRGCSACCQQVLTLSPVELEWIRGAVDTLPAELRARLADRVESQDSSGPCPLLEGDACVVYAARPTICRSHGAPILVREEHAGDEPRRDVCPLNFTGALPLASVPATDVLDLDRLNAMLSLINRLSVEESGGLPERESVLVALRRWLDRDGVGR